MNFWEIKFKIERRFKKTTNSTILIFSFIIVILIGGILLSLPISVNSKENIGFLDALFVATSATCVTGLSTVTTFSTWSIFGKVVIILLIQIGSLGFMTFVISGFIIMGKSVGLKQRVFIQQAFNQNKLEGMIVLVKYAVIGSFIIEGIGAVLLSIHFFISYDMSIIKSLSFGIFHSISAFCNAGFDILGNDSLNRYVGNYSVNIIIMLLIMLGGLGFAVWIEILSITNDFRLGKKKISFYFSKISLHSKIVLSFTIILTLIGGLFFLASEWENPNTIGNLNTGQKILASFFQSVSLRTAGFTSIPQNELKDSSKFMSIILMFIGGGSGGTAGGVKVTTFAVVIFSVVSVIRGRENIEIYNKTIPFNMLQNSLTIVLMNFSFILVATMLLSIFESQTVNNLGIGFEFMDFLYETASAVSTVGLTTGLTSYLTDMSKIVLIICMFAGRIGTITVVIALTQKRNTNNNLIKYPEEKIMIG